MPRRRVLTIALAGLALAVPGCGDDDDAGEATPDRGPAQRSAGEEAESSGGAGGGAPARGALQVEMKDIKFIPAEIQVEVGQAVNWTNRDSVPHTATARRGAEFDSGELGSGENFSFTPRKAGRIAYVCKIHPGQRGSITVTD
jgi:plastocyanin